MSSYLFTWIRVRSGIRIKLPINPDAAWLMQNKIRKRVCSVWIYRNRYGVGGGDYHISLGDIENLILVKWFVKLVMNIPGERVLM